jgi:hypothetical protein
LKSKIGIEQRAWGEENLELRISNGGYENCVRAGCEGLSSVALRRKGLRIRIDPGLERPGYVQASLRDEDLTRLDVTATTLPRGQ